MATATTEPTTIKPVIPSPWDPNCPGCLSGIGPTPDDPIRLIAEPAPAEVA